MQFFEVKLQSKPNRNDYVNDYIWERSQHARSHNLMNGIHPVIKQKIDEEKKWRISIAYVRLNDDAH